MATTPSRARGSARTLHVALMTTALAGGVAFVAAPGTASAATAPTFVQAAFVEPGNGTVVLPLQHGTSRGRPVEYVITETSDGSIPTVNKAAKLANARGTAAVQPVTVNADGTLDFPATVDFGPDRVVVAGPQGFPPARAEAGAQAESGYSPLALLPDGRVINAPHVANDTGRGDKVVAIDEAASRVTYAESSGFVGFDPVQYISTDASDCGVAALEGVTCAPALAAAPAAGDDDPNTSARAGLIAFVNGRTGASNPNRQGLNSALLDGLSPLNVLRWKPRMTRYSPLWDVHLAQWTPLAFASNQVVRRTDFGAVLGDVGQRLVSGPGGAAFGPSGVVVNCPVISVR